MDPQDLIKELHKAVKFKEFLMWHLEATYRKNVFTEEYGPERAKRDGKAEIAQELFQLLEDIDGK